MMWLSVSRTNFSSIVIFFEALVSRAYNGYYMDPNLIALLGLETRPPQPRGYSVELGDLRGLERVKGRGQVYRDA